jgi:heme/copper-type cytochrome/quinol oxidase subunit 2
MMFLLKARSTERAFLFMVCMGNLANVCLTIKVTMIELSLLQSTQTVVIAIILFICLIVFYILGYRLRIRTMNRNPEHTKEDFGGNKWNVAWVTSLTPRLYLWDVEFTI